MRSARVAVGRLAAAVGLLALIVVGLDRPDLEFLSGGAAESSSTALTEVLAWIFVPLSCCAAILLLLGVGFRRRPEGDTATRRGSPRQGWLAALFTRLVGLLVLVSVGYAVYLVFRTEPADESGRTAEPPAASSDVDRPDGAPGTTTGPGEAGDLVLVLAAVGVGLVILAGAVVARRALRRARAAPEARSDAASLAEAVSAGRRALRGVDDDRAAIIACYAAMEDAFARRGVGRLHSDTAGDHLRRATEAGLVSPAAVEELLAVFGRARFSAHPIRRGERETAERVLDGVRVRPGDRDPADTEEWV